MAGLDLREYAGLFAGYTELRVQENRSTYIAFVKGNNTANVRSVSSGVSARTYRNGSWGFASSPEITPDAVSSVVKQATDNALFLDSREGKAKGPLAAPLGSSENDFSTRKPRLSQKELLDFVRQVDDGIAGRYPRLASRSVYLQCLDIEKTLLTSDGSYAYSMIPRSRIHVLLCVEKDGQPVELMDSYGGLGQFEDVFDSPSSVWKEIEQQYEHLMRKSEGVFADAGVKTCVLDAELAGILAHEAIGHTCEADLVMGGSVAGDWMGRKWPARW